MTSVLDSLGSLAISFTLNTLSMVILIYGMYYRRHGDRVLANTAAMFNIFAFAVLDKLSSVEFGLAAGFGLFAILALLNLRSETIGRIEIAYFFGSIAIAVICSIQGSSHIYVVAILVVALFSIYVIDHPNLYRGTRAIQVTLDKVDAELIANPEAMRRVLSERLQVEVKGFEVLNMNFVNKRATISLTYQKAMPPTPQESGSDWQSGT